METEGYIEKRQFPRLKCSVPMQYRRIGTLDNGDSGALSKNISGSGARVISEEFIPLNSRVIMDFSLPFTEQKIKSICKIIWIKRFITLSSYDLGIQFVDMTIKNQQEITNFIKVKFY